MTNDDSYKMMNAMRRHMGLNVYETDKTLEIVLTFKTTDGKVHQICNSFKEKKDDYQSNQRK
jgi:hypothetical protein